MGLFDFGEKLPNPELFDVVNELYDEMNRAFEHTFHSAEASHPSVTQELLKPAIASEPESVEADNIYQIDEQRRRRDLANGALNGAVYHENAQAQRVAEARDELDDIFGRAA